MRIPTPIQALSAAAALALLAGCSGGSAIAPKPTTPQGVHGFMHGQVPAAVGFRGALNIHPSPNHRASFDACPATGAIEYISDFNSSTVYIFAGKFASQAPCGMLTTGLLNPQGLFIKGHDLYVANTGNQNWVAFHRGQTMPFLTGTDSLSNYVVDITKAKDGTVIVTNIFNANTGVGSISTFSSTGTFLNNYPNPAGAADYFLTVNEHGTVYYDDSTLGVYSLTCPAGVCGAQTSTGIATSFPGGIRSADEDTSEKEDLVVDDQNAKTLTTFETFPTGTSCANGGTDDVSFDISKSNKHVFLADYNGSAGTSTGDELSYSNGGATCTLIGSVSDPGGLSIGAAADPAGKI